MDWFLYDRNLRNETVDARLDNFHKFKTGSIKTMNLNIHEIRCLAESGWHLRLLSSALEQYIELEINDIP